MNKIRKYPFVKQRDEKDCAVACLSMIIRYYNGNIPYNTLYDMLECSHRGTSAYQLVTTACDIGFTAKGVSCNLADIPSSSLPCIAHVILDEKYYHYVVIYKIDWAHRKVFVADPIDSLKTFSIEKFESIFNKIIITLYPVCPIPQCEMYSQVKKYFHMFIKMHKKKLVLCILYSLFFLFFSFGSSMAILLLLNHSSMPISVGYIICFLCIYFCKSVVLFAKDYIAERMVQIFNESLMMDTFRNIILLPYKVYCNRSTGEIASRLNDAAHAGEILGTYTVNFGVNLLFFLFSFICFIRLSLLGTWILLILCTVYFVLYCKFDKGYHKTFASVKRKSGEMNHKLIEAIEGFETIKGINQEKQVVQMVTEDYHAYFKKVNCLRKKEIRQTAIGTFLEDVIYLWIGIVGIVMFRQAIFSLETFLLFYSLSTYVVIPIRDFAHFVHDKKELQEILDRIQDFAWKREERKEKVCHLIKELKCKQLFMTFDDFKTPVFDCTLYNNDKVFIYGKSGGGKSTFLKILKGYYQNYNGRIFINQMEIGEYDRETIQRQIVYVSQQETLFTGTIYENLCMGKDIDKQKLTKVLAITKVNDILESRQIGLSTLIEENGSNFSGGERQRIVLARCLLQGASIYMFDESFSEMDANMERMILKNIMDVFPKIMIVVVSHRFDNQDLFNAHIYVDSHEAIFQRKKCMKGGLYA